MRWKNLRQGYENPTGKLSAKLPHEVLGIAADSTAEVIRAAYLSMVKTYHPDKSSQFMAGHNQEVLKVINEAYALMMRNKP